MTTQAKRRRHEPHYAYDKHGNGSLRCRNCPARRIELPPASPNTRTGPWRLKGQPAPWCEGRG